jgi:hypothetical protein
MQYETEQIVNAIKSLKQEESLLKDYLFPIASAFFSSMLGWVIAYKFFHYQDSIIYGKEKTNTINRLTIICNEARSTLFAIKYNYHGQLTNYPYQRATLVPEILINNNPITEDYSLLSFIAPKSLSNEYSKLSNIPLISRMISKIVLWLKRNKQNKSSSEHPKWSNIALVSCMISNYNTLLGLWLKRNEIKHIINNRVAELHSNKAYTDLSIDEMIKYTGKDIVIQLIDLTERCIISTDDLIIELTDFLSHFPVLAKSKVKYKPLTHYDPILTYSNDGNDYIHNIQQKSPVADYTSVCNLFGLTIEQMNQRYSTGY